MFKAPLKTTFIASDTSGSPLTCTAWNDVQSAVGQGFATAVIKTPERRGDRPELTDYKPNKTNPPVNNKQLRISFDHLIWVWRLAFETLLNRQWDLVENPYAKVWILPDMLLVHEDPLGWLVDAAAEDIAAGQPYEDTPCWTILRPMPSSNHAMMSTLSPQSLPHSKSLDRALTKAAREEGHEDITPLCWEPIPGQSPAKNWISLKD
jgi:hypothetical protein